MFDFVAPVFVQKVAVSARKRSTGVAAVVDSLRWAYKNYFTQLWEFEFEKFQGY